MASTSPTSTRTSSTNGCTPDQLVRIHRRGLTIWSGEAAKGLTIWSGRKKPGSRGARLKFCRRGKADNHLPEGNSCLQRLQFWEDGATDCLQRSYIMRRRVTLHNAEARMPAMRLPHLGKTRGDKSSRRRVDWRVSNLAGADSRSRETRACDCARNSSAGLCRPGSRGRPARARLT